MRNYRKVDVCHREIRADTDLFLDVNENDGCIGPLKSCFSGFGAYFCLMQGCTKSGLCGGRIELEEELKRKWWKRSVGWLQSDFSERRRMRNEEGEEGSAGNYNTV